VFATHLVFATQLVFATHLGTPRLGTVPRDSRKRRLRRAKPRPTYRFHDLRNTVAALMLAAGIDIPMVAAVLDHSRSRTTLDIYAHAVPSNLVNGPGAIQRALRAAGLAAPA
jgi:integrase